MSAGNITFKDAIQAYARNNGIALPPDHVDILDSVLRSLGKVDGNVIAFDMGQGQIGTFEDLMSRETEGVARIGSTKSDEIEPAGLTPTDYAVARNRAARETRSAAAVSAIVSDGNPWAKETWSRTHQALVTNASPTLANQLKASAGINA